MNDERNELNMAKECLREMFAQMVIEDPRTIALLPQFLNDLDDLARKAVAEIKNEQKVDDPKGSFDKLVDAIQSRRPQVDHGDSPDLQETTIVIEAAKAWRGERRVFADVVVKAKHAGEFKADTDALAGISAAIMHMVEQMLPMPKGGRIEFAHGGRVVRFGGDEITEDIAISMAEDLIGAPRSDRQ